MAQYDQREMGSLSRFAERLQDVSAAGAVDTQLGIVAVILLLMLFATRLPACLPACLPVSVSLPPDCCFLGAVYYPASSISLFIL